MVRKLFVLLGLVGLGGCSGMSDNVMPPTELGSIQTSMDSRQFWDVDTGAGNDGQYFSFAPLITGTRLITVDLKGQLTALDKNNGKQAWQIDLDLPVVAGVAGGAGKALVGGEEGDLVAVAADSGEILWKVELDGQVVAISDIDSDIAVVRLSGGKTVAVDVSDGKLKWEFDREQPNLTLHGQGVPLTAHGGVALGMDDGSLLMLQLRTGRPIWEAVLATGRGRTELDRLVDVDGTLVLSREEVFAVSYQGKIAAINARNGKLNWSVKASSNTGVSVDNRAVYFSDDEGVVHALSRNSGIELWTQEGLKYRRVTRPTIVDGAVVVADYEGYLHWLDKNTGKFVQRKRAASSGILVPPKRFGDRLAVLADDGELSVWQAVKAQ